MAGLLITLSGVDGAGKSTQLGLLEAELVRRGRRVERLWYRPGYSARLDALRAAVRRRQPGLLPRAGRGAARSRAFESPLVRGSWLTMALLDTLAEYALKVRLLLTQGNVVLCDRYLPDALLDLRLRFPDMERLHRGLGPYLGALCPEPDCAFLLMIPPDEIQRRLASKQEPFPDLDSVRDARYAAYVEMSGTGDLTVIDASRPVDAVQRTLLRHLPALG